MSEEVKNDHHGHIKGFPYHADVAKYAIHKKNQRSLLWKQLVNPHQFCMDMKRNEKIWKILFWLGITFALMAITVSLVKELDEGKVEEDTILNLSIAELVLAIIAVVISLSKHCIKYNSIIELQKNIKTKKQKLDEHDALSNRKKVYASIISLLIIFILVELVGFLSLHLKKDSTSADLIYTKYTTTLTLFLVLALDGVINDILNDAHSKAEADQYRLLVHQLYLELKMYLSQHDSISRVTELQAFLDSSELYSMDDDHFLHIHDAETNFPIKDDDGSLVNDEKSDIENEHLVDNKTYR